MQEKKTDKQLQNLQPNKSKILEKYHKMYQYQDYQS